MKRYICLIISLCLILGSFSFVFASATSWDTSDQTNLSNAASRLYYNGYSAAYYLKLISDRIAVLSTISSDISTIKGYLFDDGHSIAYWVSAISSWMQPIYNSITNGVLKTDIEPLISGLNEVTTSGGTTSYKPYLKDIKEGLTNIDPSAASYSASQLRNNSHLNLVSNTTGRYNRTVVGQNGSISTSTILWSNGSPLGNVAYLVQTINNNLAAIYGERWKSDVVGYNSTQNALNWGNLGTSTFIPQSSIDGTYKWLAAIQAPVARLSYVLASDERIAAQEAAALAEQEVVDDFIDPTGDSSATASDFGSISVLSSGYQQNFGSTASVSGIFDIFDSNNFGWFSSETYNQLDTTVAQRGSNFETPLLDQQLDDISRALGVDYAN